MSRSMRPRPAGAIAWWLPTRWRRPHSAVPGRSSARWRDKPRLLSPWPQLAAAAAPIPPALAIVRLAVDIDRVLLLASGGGRGGNTGRGLHLLRLPGGRRARR